MNMVRLDIPGRRQKRQSSKRALLERGAEAEKLVEGLKKENGLLQARVDELEAENERLKEQLTQLTVELAKMDGAK